MPVDLVGLYKNAKEESLKRAMPGKASGKAEKVRKPVKEIAMKTGEKKLLAAAAYQAVKAALAEQGLKIERTYFMQVVKKAFKLEKTQDGRVLIVIE